jgi:ABC-type phosphate transport system substrate-binding protein
MIALPTTAAFAHDCFVANRSAQGAIGAGNSSTVTDFAHGWVSFSVAEILEASGVSDVDAALAEWLAAGNKAFLATRVDKVIGEGSNNQNFGDGSGLEHFSESPVLGSLVDLILKYGGTPDFE